MLEKLSHEKREIISVIKAELIDLYNKLGADYENKNSTETVRNGLVEMSRHELNELYEVKDILANIKELIIG